MATIRKDFTVAHAPYVVWEVFRDINAVHTRLARGFVTDARAEEGARVVTFANGMSAREVIVSVDDARRRLVYAVVGSPNLTHHNASFEVLPGTDGGARVVWTADILPDAAAATLDGMMEAGVRAMAATLGQIAAA